MPAPEAAPGPLFDRGPRGGLRAVRRVLHIRLRSVANRTAESRANRVPASADAPLPCAQTPLGAHGSPTTDHDGRQVSAKCQRKTASSSSSPFSPMCKIRARA